MKKYLVIGNPIDHSLSPKLHNHWLKENNIDAIYKKKKINDNEIKNVILKVRKNQIQGINVTVPFKKDVIPYLDILSEEASSTRSVNTIYLDKNKVVGHNTDAEGFRLSLQNMENDLKGKKVFILGAGGVVSSIIYSLERMGVSQITLANRTRSKADELKKIFKNLNLIEWGLIPKFDMIINATSLGLNNNDNLGLKFSNSDRGKFFYDIIYNPGETNFLKTGKNLGGQILNGKMMFIYQAYEAFKIWHKVEPKIDENLMKILDT